MATLNRCKVYRSPRWDSYRTCTAVYTVHVLCILSPLININHVKTWAYSHKLYNCQNSSFWCWYFPSINKHCFHDFNLVNPYNGLFEIYTENKVVGLIISNSPRQGFLINFNKMFNLYKYTSFKVKKNILSLLFKSQLSGNDQIMRRITQWVIFLQQQVRVK